MLICKRTPATAFGRLAGGFFFLLLLAWPDQARSATSEEKIPSTPSPQAERCALSEATTQWLVRLAEGWARVSTDVLEIPALPFPETVAYDQHCVWRLAPATPAKLPEEFEEYSLPIMLGEEAVPVYAAHHQGTIVLPSEAEIPADIIAATMSGPEYAPAFLVIALPEIWEAHPKAGQDALIRERILSAAMHEIIHVRQLPTALAKVRALKEEHALPENVTDMIVETRFADNEGYAQAFLEEKALFFKAALTESDEEKLRLARLALQKARDRRARFFTGDDQVYGSLEDIFINLEGLAEWTRFQYHMTEDENDRSRREVADFLVGRGNEWLQDEGLAVFMLIGDLGADWKAAAVHDMAPPYDLLEAAIARHD